MKTMRKKSWILLMLFIVASYGSGCTGAPKPVMTKETAVHENLEDESNILVLPELSAVELDGKPLKVVATTSMIGDVVAQVGGQAIDLTILMGAGQDPHSYKPGAQELTAVADADVIFVNGWDLEESLARDLVDIGGGTPIVPISAKIVPLTFGENEHDHEIDGAVHEEPADEQVQRAADPHVWFSIQNVEQWTQNATRVLGDLDPANTEIYKSNAAAYYAELTALEAYANEQLGQIPEENRFLVTNHDSLSYFAHEYGFELIGNVIPGTSTLAEPSASDLADLIGEMKKHDLCTIFTETSVSDTLAQTVASEIDNCDDVHVIKLYTGSVGPIGSGADSYIGMFRANVDAVVEGLR
jgi:ABC-type Zn uptake system ZnuABC Zn-binding protein ZnuA